MIDFRLRELLGGVVRLTEVTMTRWVLAAATAILVLCGCGSAGQSTDGDRPPEAAGPGSASGSPSQSGPGGESPAPATLPEPPSSGEPNPAAQARLQEAIRRWRTSDVGGYRLTYEQLCRCVGAGKATVTVSRGGEVLEVLPRRSGIGPPITVERLFRLARQQVQSGSKTHLAYHPVRGYPTRLTVGSIAVDAGYTISVVELVPQR